MNYTCNLHQVFVALLDDFGGLRPLEALAASHAPSLLSQLRCKPRPWQAGSQEKRRGFGEQSIKRSVR
ncbi:MAG: hypothetical protein E6K27_04815 [Gammaproteobacteria bacterium]|nr:MAG: hypothetical protein E6K27_04815 [Gammaproteobacteria bacterium]